MFATFVNALVSGVGLFFGVLIGVWLFYFFHSLLSAIFASPPGPGKLPDVTGPTPQTPPVRKPPE
jgi:ABC-type branched-subunit amino acid transport system permease subunit